MLVTEIERANGHKPTLIPQPKERKSYEQRPLHCQNCDRYLGTVDLRDGSITLKCKYCKCETTLTVRPPGK